MSKKNVILLYGGNSTEHEISIRSARNIARATNTSLFNMIPIGIAKNGTWYLKTLEELNNEEIVLSNDDPIALVPGYDEQKIINIKTQESIGKIDIAFPIVHGTNGEDGTLQGLLKTMQIPFVGPGVIGSALCIDKDVAKRLMNEAHIPNAAFLSYQKSERNQITFEKVVNSLGLPMYIKPPNLGSSVGISKVNSKREFDKAVDHAFLFDQKIIIEKNIKGREIECAVLGNTNPKASLVGEVVTINENHDFYSYKAKYIDANGSKTVIPADLSEDLQNQIQTIALKTYKTLCCQGMARVDVFVTPDNKIIVNEVNTLPGFTDISMYPKLWEASGIDYNELISKLLVLALERSDNENENLTQMNL
jgi:D-alanine-D-alanine ligase